jgi:hypothetical protein
VDYSVENDVRSEEEGGELELALNETVEREG